MRKVLLRSSPETRFGKVNLFSNWFVLVKHSRDQKHVERTENCWNVFQQSLILLFIVMLCYLHCINKIQQQKRIWKPLKFISWNLFAKTVNSFWVLTFFAKRLFLRSQKNDKFLDKSIYFWLAFESYCFHGHA